MQPLRRLVYLSLANCVAFIVGSQIAHNWLNPMHDYIDFISRAEEEYQASRKEQAEVEAYLAMKRQKLANKNS